MKYCKVEFYELSWFNQKFIILSQFLTMPKKDKIINIYARKDKIKIINISKKCKQWYIKTYSNLLIC